MERIRILLVDDDRQNSELLKKFLEVEGYEVDYAEHGRAGWKMYAANRPDLVLLDINMPLMNGFELAKMIREQDRDVLIFFLTDRTEKADRLKGFDLKGNDYIPKPFYPEELIAKIRERFEHRRSSLQSRMTIGQTQHIGQTVERSYLLEHVWGNDSYANSLALNVQITYIRKMLEPDTSISIVSLKKRGYRLEVM